MNERYLDDALLIQRSQQGDLGAFDALIRKYETKAFQYAYRLTRDPEDASDIVSEAFVRVYNALHNFKGQSAFSTWLYRILTNCFLDARKRDKHKAVASLDATIQTNEGEVLRQVEDPKRNPYEESEKTEREIRVDVALNKLPEYQRAMLVMYHSEMMSYEDIAAALDLPLGTVKSRLNRARLSLRDLLRKDEELFRI